MHSSMTGRPRPVTATVTKPRWMQVPDPDAIAKIRRKSLESNGSTESLTSLLDHDSYICDSEELDDLNKKEPMIAETPAVPSTTEKRGKQRTENLEKRPRSASPSKSSSNNTLSAWDQWIIRKAKDDQRRKLEERNKKRQEKAEKDNAEKEKQAKLKKAEIVRQEWLQAKNENQVLEKKMERIKIRNEKRKKEELELQIKQKAEEKFAKWAELKDKEERQRKQKVKEENIKIKQHQERRKQMAEQRFQQWLKQAHTQRRSSPNSYGYLSGKVKDYHDRNAYPTPNFYNPIPWHPPAIPPPQKTERAYNCQKKKPKPYKWNPEKYF